MSPLQRRDALTKLTPNKQLDVYLAGNRQEPGINFAYEVAGNWRVVLPVLKERLTAEPDEANRFHLLWLLASIAENFCDLRQRQDVLQVASKAVAAMSGGYKQYAEEPLRRITNLTTDKQLPACQ